MDIRQHFRDACKQRRIHIEQMRAQRDAADTDKRTRQHLARKIVREQKQLAAISDIWNVR